MANLLNFKGLDFVTVYCRKNAHGAPILRSPFDFSLVSRITGLLRFIEPALDSAYPEAEI